MATQGQNTAQVGSINVGVEADLTGLRSGLRQAEAEAKAAAPKIAAAASVPLIFPVGDKSGASRAGGGVAGAAQTAAAATGLRSWGQTLKNATAPLRAFQQGIQSFLSIGMRFLGWFGLAVSAFQLFKAAADRLSGPLRQMQAEIDAVAEKIAKLREEQSKLAADTAKELGRAPIAEDFLSKLKRGVGDARRELERINEEIRSRQSAPMVPGSPQELENQQKLNALYKEQNKAKSNLLLLMEREADLSKRISETDKDKTDLAQQRLDIERRIAITARRAAAQQSAMTDRMAADISRMTSLLEIMVRQRVGR